MTEAERKAKKAAYMKVYGAKNRERRAAYAKAYREANKSKIDAASRAYYAANREKISAYYAKNREKRSVRWRAYYAANSEKIDAGRALYRKRTRERSLLNASLVRAAKHKMEHNIDLEDIVIPDVCPVLGIKLDRYAPNHAPNLPSLDRVDSSKGYIKGNVRVISWRANRLKQAATLGELLAIYEYVLDHTVSNLPK